MCELIAYSKVLVLNRFYVPVHVTSVKRAFSMLYQGVAKVVTENYEIFDFQSWRRLSISLEDDVVHTVDCAIRVPRVILLATFDRMPKQQVRFSRVNVYIRDRNTCQYCGNIFPKNELNLDHVIPRSQGGLSIWENVVCSCIRCNRQKGGRTPEQAGMYLIRLPKRPKITLVNHLNVTTIQYQEWMAFLNLVDVSYWRTDQIEE